MIENDYVRNDAAVVSVDQNAYAAAKARKKKAKEQQDLLNRISELEKRLSMLELLVEERIK